MRQKRRGTVWVCLCLASVVLCTGDVVGGDGDDGSVKEISLEFCVQETNRYRVMNGRAAVTRSKALEEFANTGARVDHTGAPHGHFRQAGDSGFASAENECPRYSLDQSGGDMKTLVAVCLASFYSEGPGGGHYENMLGDYASVGCGIFQSGTSVTLVQDFAH